MEFEGSLPHSQVPATCPVPSQLDPVHTPTFRFMKIHLKIILRSMPGSFKLSLLFSFPPHNPSMHLSSIRATSPAHLILLDLIPRIIFSKQYSSLSSSLCSFLHSPVALSFLGPNILLKVLFSNALSLCPSLSVRDQVLHPYKVTGKNYSSVYLNLSIFYDNLEDKRFCTELQQAFPDCSLP